MTAARVRRGAAALVLAVLPSAAPAWAGGPPGPGDGTWVGVSQTVVASAAATGEVTGTPKVFTEVTAVGHGPADLRVPMAASGLRDLAGSGRPPVVDGEAVWSLDLKGTATRRTVSDFDRAQLPVKVSATYRLDGEELPARDVVGRSGRLTVTYRIENTTTAPTPVTFTSVRGAADSRSVAAPVPLAATVTVALPAGFAAVRAPGATVAPDATGRGTSTAVWSLFLFDPLGGVDQSVGYQADVTDAVVPPATVGVAPLAPTAPGSPAAATGPAAAGLAPPGPELPRPELPGTSADTVGSRVAALQNEARASVQDLAAKASAVLTDLQQTALPAAQQVAAGAAEGAAALKDLPSDARTLSTAAAGAAADSAGAAERASELARRERAARERLEQLPGTVRDTQAYRLLRSELLVLEARASEQAAELAARAVEDRLAEAGAQRQAAGLEARASAADALAAQAAQAAAALAAAAVPRSGPGEPVRPEELGDSAGLRSAVDRLDAAIAQSGDEVDRGHAGLLALDRRSAQYLLPAGNATGASAQTGSFVITVRGADAAGRQTGLAALVGGSALLLALTLGVGLHRVRHGLPSSLRRRTGRAEGVTGGCGP
ncbi:hypothetical protein [Kitasatospora terrestris]|uniref:Uncharacterized protein n=1 Tax=Kitasatospora terrestris TaxID=258051 RepID=A0ABP9DPM8_9ACTN